MEHQWQVEEEQRIGEQWTEGQQRALLQQCNKEQQRSWLLAQIEEQQWLKKLQHSDKHGQQPVVWQQFRPWMYSHAQIHVSAAMASANGPAKSQVIIFDEKDEESLNV